MAFVCERGAAQRRACALMSVARSAWDTSGEWCGEMRQWWQHCTSCRRSNRAMVIGASRCHRPAYRSQGVIGI